MPFQKPHAYSNDFSPWGDSRKTGGYKKEKGSETNSGALYPKKADRIKTTMACAIFMPLIFVPGAGLEPARP